MRPFTKKVPAESDTHCPEAQPLSALLMAVVVSVEPFPYVEALSVAQAVVRLGMPPGIPAVDQSIARVGSRTPDHACPLTAVGIINKRKEMKKGNRRPRNMYFSLAAR